LRGGTLGLSSALWGESPPAARPRRHGPDEGRDHRPLRELPRNGSDRLHGALKVELVEVLLPQNGLQLARELTAQLAESIGRNIYSASDLKLAAQQVEQRSVLDIKGAVPDRVIHVEEVANRDVPPRQRCPQLLGHRLLKREA
jgi:hypothetical protein